MVENSGAIKEWMKACPAKEDVSQGHIWHSAAMLPSRRPRMSSSWAWDSLWCYLLLLHQLFLVLFVLLSGHPCSFGRIGGGGLLLFVASTTETHSWQGVPHHALQQESHLQRWGCLLGRDEVFWVLNRFFAAFTLPSRSWSRQIHW